MSYQPRSTNPYIMEKKLNECVGGGGFDPSVLEEIEAEISVLGSENATMAQDIIDIKGSLNSINDNLSGFKFYPIGTNLVALVVDDSFYTDTNDKYVLADSPTGQTLLADTATYKALASIEDCRGEVGADTATPFSKVEDINPNKIIDWGYGAIRFNSADGYSINVANYKKVWLCFLQAVSGSSSFSKIAFYDNNKQQVGSSFLLNLVAQTWSDAIEIPKGAIYLVLLTTSNMSSNYVTWSLKA